MARWSRRNGEGDGDVGRLAEEERRRYHARRYRETPKGTPEEERAYLARLAELYGDRDGPA
jgi:hypothetical protein